MIRITVELISAQDGHSETIGTMFIVNDGTGTETRGNYNAVFWAKRRAARKRVRVDSFPRQRLNAWHLIHRVLTDWLKPKAK